MQTNDSKEQSQAPSALGSSGLVRARSEFLKLPMEERRKLLEECCTPEMVRHYEVTCPECGNYYGGHATGAADICDCHNQQPKPMGKCTKCGTNFVGTAENPPPDGLCRYCEMDRLKDALDMQRDEFKRIIALGPDPEILGICKRAISTIEQTVPVTVQRDKFKSAASKLRNALAALVSADTAKELDEMELGLRLMPGIEADKIAAVNAIHALRETLAP